MSRMRVSFLLALVSSVALADVATPAPVAVDGRPVRVFFAGGKIHVATDAGPELLLDPAGTAYLGAPARELTVKVVDGAAPHAQLLLIGSHPEACSDYWDRYVSVAGGAPHVVLSLDGVADPPAFATPSVKFDARAGTAVVTTRVTEEEGARPRVTRRRYRWNGTTFVPLSKRAPTESK